MNVSSRQSKRHVFVFQISLLNELLALCTANDAKPTIVCQQLTDNLNEFYCRFEKTPHTRSEHLSTQPLTPPATPLSPTPAVQSSEYDMCQVFRSIKKSTRPRLFVDISSAFNTSIPNLHLPKLSQLSMPTSVCQWITSFLTVRQQLVKLGNTHPALVLSVLELIRAVFSPH